MTGTSTLFSSYRQHVGEVKIIVADGRSSIVAGVGNLNLFRVKARICHSCPKFIV